MKIIIAVPRIESNAVSVEPATIVEIETSEAETLAYLATYEKVVPQVLESLERIAKEFAP